MKQLRDKSGFGWDEGLSRVTATDKVWAALVAVSLIQTGQYDVKLILLLAV